MPVLMPLKKIHRTIRHCCYFLGLAVLISACGSQTTQQSTAFTVQSLEQEIQQIEQQNTLEGLYQLVDIAERLRILGETEKALSVINRIDSNKLPDDQYIRYVTVASDIYSDDQSIFQSSELLSNDRLQGLWSQLTIEQQTQFHRQRAQTFSQIGDIEASIAEHIILDSLLVDPLDIMENHESLWQSLIQQPLQILESPRDTDDFVTQGWYELATLSKQNETNLEAKRVSINNWVSLNPSHPAAVELPLDLQLLNTLIAERPKKIGLLLPVNGKLALAGKTIRDGFLAAYFNQGLEYRPEVVLYDTSQADINTVYDQAINEGVELIVGPLQKEKVTQLHQRKESLVTTLALNYITDEAEIADNALDGTDLSIAANTDIEQPASDTALQSANLVANNFPTAEDISEDETATKPENLGNTELPFYQFGLSLEDEAQQTANRAWLEGHRYAMVIASKADWSQRAVKSFTERWQEFGGSVIVSSQLNKSDSYSNTIKAALDINKSESRARQLKRLFGKNFEFEPRRRQDIDMIFLVTRAKEGQQIKPTLSFHYAGNIPVYATSQIYTQSQSVGQNKDLNGIRFITLPWTLYPEEHDENLINAKVNIPANFSRLYALGIDAYYLHDRLRQLDKLPNTSVFGTTGKLSLSTDKRIMREQPWAQVVDGEAKPLPQLTQKDNSFE